MVALEVPILGYLPVRTGKLPAGEHVPVRQAEGVQLRPVVAEPTVDVERRAGGQDAEDEARPLSHRQRGEPHRVLLDRAKGLAVGHGQEAAVAAVGPAVVGAGEAARLAAAGLDQLRPPMAADIEEGLYLSRGGPGDEDGYAGHRLGPVGARLPQLAAEGESDRHPAEHPVHLGLEAGRIAVVGDRDRVGAGRLVGRPLLEVIEQPAGGGDEVGPAEVLVGRDGHQRPTNLSTTRGDEQRIANSEPEVILSFSPAPQVDGRTIRSAGWKRRCRCGVRSR